LFIGICFLAASAAGGEVSRERGPPRAELEILKRGGGMNVRCLLIYEEKLRF
jgi:hypothetical protein